MSEPDRTAIDRAAVGKAFLVAQRELFENLRTKAFWIGILTFPVILVLATVVPLLLQGAKDAREYVLVDRSGWLLEEIAPRLDAEGGDRFVRRELAGTVDPDTNLDALVATLRRQVAADEIFAYAVLGTDAERPHDAAFGVADTINDQGTDEEADEDSGEAVGFRYASANLTDDDLRAWLEGIVSDAIQARRLDAAALDPELVAWVSEPIRFEVVNVRADGVEAAVGVEDMVRQWAPAGFVYLLWIAIFSIAQMLLTNTIEEKSNRLMEVLLSSVSPLQLMAGKILGIAATGLAMLAGWSTFVLLGLAIPLLLGVDLPLDLRAVVDPIYLASFVVYFLLGYLFYAGVLVGIGAVCNSLKEAQNLQTPVLVTLMLPLFAMIPIAEDPNGLLAKVLSYIPPFTPFVMMNRAAGPPTLPEYAITTGLLLVSVAGVLWAAAKVFRVGILMTGKPPRLREILRWVRAPVGAVPEDRRMRSND